MRRDHLKQNDDVIRTVYGSLFDVATELRAMSYLFETQGTKANDIAEADMDEISHGLGRILRRLAKKVRKSTRLLDESLS